jgi:L-fuconolactonase
MTGLEENIDAHQHFWSLDRGDYHWLTLDMALLYRDFGPAELAPFLQRHGIGGTVLVQAAATVAETEYMLAIAAATDFVKGVVGWIDFESTTGPAEINRLAEHPKLKGFRPMIQDIPDPEWMLRAAVGPAMAHLQHLGLSFDALVKPRHLEPLRRFLPLYPELGVVIDHGAKPDIAGGQFDDWARELRKIARNDHVYCKISGLVTEAGPDWQPGDLTRYLDLLLEAFGPARLMWGSDWPVVNEAGGYAAWHSAAVALTEGCSQDDRDLIFGGAAQAFYGIAA